MDCCELVKSAHQIILGAFGVILLLVAMLLGYNLKLGKRTAKLEKKNGKEQHQIDELRKEVEQLKKPKETK
jgi:hypothetical protein